MHGGQVISVSAALSSTAFLMSQLTLPVMSYFSGGGLRRTIEAALGPDTDISDLWIPFL
jgi:hypothetical protein